MLDNIYAELKQKGIRVKLGRIHREDLVKAAKIIMAMAKPREHWIDRCQEQLEGALGEYVKYRCALLRNAEDYWSHEIKNLLTQLHNMFDATKIKTTGFDRYKAFKEALERAKDAQPQVTTAINDYIRMLQNEEKCSATEIKKFREKLKKAKFNSQSLLKDMLLTFLDPHILKKSKTYIDKLNI
jgi:hypothetical protein